MMRKWIKILYPTKIKEMYELLVLLLVLLVPFLVVYLYKRRNHLKWTDVWDKLKGKFSRQNGSNRVWQEGGSNGGQNDGKVSDGHHRVASFEFYSDGTHGPLSSWRDVRAVVYDSTTSRWSDSTTVYYIFGVTDNEFNQTINQFRRDNDWVTSGTVNVIQDEAKYTSWFEIYKNGRTSKLSKWVRTTDLTQNDKGEMVDRHNRVYYLLTDSHNTSRLGNGKLGTVHVYTSNAAIVQESIADGDVDGV